MYLNFLKVEAKNIIRDKMTIFMLIYPILLGLLGRFVLPSMLENDPAGEFGIQLVIVVFALITGFMYGAVAGFSLVDDRDDNVLISLKITPMSVKKYLTFKFATIYFLAVISSVFIILFSQAGFSDAINKITFLEALSVSCLSSMMAIMNAFLINSIATNKVEAFAIMKGSGFLLIAPLISLMWTDWKEFLLGIAPTFWPAKAMMTLLVPSGTMNMSFAGYMSIGWIYTLILTYLIIKLFNKKNNI